MLSVILLFVLVAVQNLGGALKLNFERTGKTLSPYMQSP
jgi:hypothetical protein